MSLLFSSLLFVNWCCSFRACVLIAGFYFYVSGFGCRYVMGQEKVSLSVLTQARECKCTRILILITPHLSSSRESFSPFFVARLRFSELERLHL